MAERKGMVHSVDKAFYLLELLLGNKEPMSLKELSAITGFPKSTIHALLATMRERGIVEQDEHGDYMLGFKLFEYGTYVYSSWDDIQLANPILSSVASQTKSNSILATLNNNNLINVGYWATTEAMQKVFPFVGTRNPLHATGQGKVFLASYDDHKLKRYIKRIGLKKYSQYTITDVDAFIKEIETIREKGFALCNGEYHENNRVISVPVYDRKMQVVYALGVLDDIHKIKDEDIKDIVHVLKKEAKKLSRLLNLQ